MYLMWGRERATERIKQKNLKYFEHAENFSSSRPDALETFSRISNDDAKRARFMINKGFPLYPNNSFSYFSTGEEAFENIIEDFRRAERFIFISFFIVAEGALWERIKPILLDKAHKGVEIRFLYDDFGSMFRTDKYFWKQLTDAGIKVGCFNPIHRYVDKLYMNYRTHQKQIIIDGNVGYTGGINLADEYTNEVMRFGNWKDCAVRIEGEGVFGLTCSFLEMWDMTLESVTPDFDRYAPKSISEGIDFDKGFCQIISDGPLNNPDNPILSIIRQMIYTSEKYLYITTPYLVLQDDVSDALCDAALSGIDVRIITPAIPDKKSVFLLTRYNYGKLLKNGVKIYEYSPGFIHSKLYVTEGMGIAGTVNLDYRSLYLHYECGACIWDRKTVDSMKADILATCELSRQMSYEEWLNRPLHIKISQWILNVFSSLV